MCMYQNEMEVRIALLLSFYDVYGELENHIVTILHTIIQNRHIGKRNERTYTSHFTMNEIHKYLRTHTNRIREKYLFLTF